MMSLKEREDLVLANWDRLDPQTQEILELVGVSPKKVEEEKAKKEGDLKIDVHKGNTQKLD